MISQVDLVQALINGRNIDPTPANVFLFLVLALFTVMLVIGIIKTILYPFSTTNTAGGEDGPHIEFDLGDRSRSSDGSWFGGGSSHGSGASGGWGDSDGGGD